MPFFTTHLSIAPGSLPFGPVPDPNRNGERGAFAADRQIRRFAVTVFKVLQPAAPWCFQDIKEHETEDGIGCLVCDNKKV